MVEIQSVTDLLAIPESSPERIVVIKNLTAETQALWASVLQAELTESISVKTPDEHEKRMKKIRLLYKLRGVR